jgi:hypothetical protein
MSAVLTVPGFWVDRSALAAALEAQPSGFRLTGNSLYDLTEMDMMLLEVRGHDKRLRRAFEIAGAGLLSQEILAGVDAHTSILYLFDEGGSRSTAQRLLRFGRALLDAGGLAIKVESSGVAHSAANWRRLELASANPLALYEAFVVMVSSDLSTWSCGMHHLGLPDAISAGPREEVNALLTRFLHYLALEEPHLEEGSLFSIENGPYYRLAREDCTMYPPDDLFHNPYGLWRLTRS